MNEEKEFVNLCLIAKPGSNMPNCHENDFCYCDIEKLKEENKKLRECVEYYSRQMGGGTARDCLKEITVFKKEN